SNSAEQYRLVTRETLSQWGRKLRKKKRTK
ncbi:MAG: hypothetical protein ACI9JU_001383, partial [Pseudohongiellaceae bacterium]